jgi:hypothetical protein
MQRSLSEASGARLPSCRLSKQKSGHRGFPHAAVSRRQGPSKTKTKHTSVLVAVVLHRIHNTTGITLDVCTKRCSSNTSWGGLLLLQPHAASNWATKKGKLGGGCIRCLGLAQNVLGHPLEQLRSFILAACTKHRTTRCRCACTRRGAMVPGTCPRCMLSQCRSVTIAMKQHTALLPEALLLLDRQTSHCCDAARH